MPAILPAPPATCNMAQTRALIRHGHSIGIPRDYGVQRNLRVVREPRQLACLGMDVRERWQWATIPAARDFARMRAAAQDDGVTIDLVSAFRSAQYQLGLIERKLERGEAIGDILKINAAPGYSEHHSGRALDLTSPGYEPIEEEFEQSDAFDWLRHNAARFRFHMSYPRGNRYGIIYEPWHWCWHPRPPVHARR